MTDSIEVDYLVVGAGAMGMAFTDTILAESDATVALVDRRGQPGGHWNDAYPFVRLHQPSSFYGVNSTPLGHDRIDELGGNAGLYELATGAEVCAYFAQVLHHRFLPSGRVHHLPLHHHDGDGEVVSLATGRRTTITAGKVVDATYQNVTVPAMRPPAFAVAPDIRCEPVNALARLEAPPDGYTVVGGGKTAMDAVLWLLVNDVDPDRITWIRPRESWLLDRANIQPGEQFAARAIGQVVAQMEAAAAAESFEDLFDRLETAGALLRLDRSIRPTMYRCATVTRSEVAALQRVERVIRLGRVERIDDDRIVLQEGSVPTGPGVLHIDCTADGLQRRPPQPVFDGDRVCLQPVRTCQQVFSAAFIAHVELARPDDEARNALCGVVPHPDTDIDWARTFLATTINGAVWNGEPDIRRWLREARLDGFSRARSGAGADPELRAMLRRVIEIGPAALTRVQELLASYDSPSTDRQREHEQGTR